MTSQRQLAAIMFTDIVGYTALMGKNSEKALELVRVSKEIQIPLVEKHNGKWLKEMGDGAMASFSTALDAVSCAIEIQESARARFDGKLRIGIHLGDVTIENGDVYGDGVNIASRIESIADPGGIYISDNIEKAIRGISNVQAKFLGELKLKNVDYEVRTYALQGVGLPIPEIKEDKHLTGHLLAEIRRRGLLRAAISYVLLSLLLILLLDQLQSWGFNLPTFTTLLLPILAIGFPVAMYFAWSFERSPEGFVKTTSKESWQNPFSASQRKPLTGPYLNVALTVIILALLVLPKFASSIESNEVGEAIPLDKSIIVLPFEDMSPNQDQGYFGDGMMEEILNHLVKIQDLKVISRTTSMNFKNSGKTTKEIAAELGVATVLEGSIRKDGNTVKITVQLIDGTSDVHLFSESYTRQLTNIFDVQSEVAQLVAEALQAEVSPEIRMRIEAIPTQSDQAYELYLKGRASYIKWWDTWDIKVVREGIEFYEQSIALDPEFSNAYAGLGQAYWMLAHWAPDYDTMYWHYSKENLRKAIELNPNNGWAYAELGVVQHNWDWDQVGALASFTKAEELSPGNLDVHWHFKTFYGRFDDCEGIAKEGRIIASLSNQNYDPNQDFDVLRCQGNIAQMSNLDPENYANFDRIWIMMYQGKYKEILEMKKDPDLFGPDNIFSYAILGEAYALVGDTTQALQKLRELDELASVRHVKKSFKAPIYMALGDEEKAFETMREALDDRDMMIHILRWFPSIHNKMDDPRYIEIMEKSWRTVIE